MEQKLFDFEQHYKSIKSEIERDTTGLYKIEAGDVYLERKKSSFDAASFGLTPKYQATKPLASVLDFFKADTCCVIRKNEKYSQYPRRTLDPSLLPELTYDIDVEAQISGSEKLNVKNIFQGQSENDEVGFDKVALDPQARLEWRFLNKDLKVNLDAIERPPVSELFKGEDAENSDESDTGLSKEFKEGRRISFEILGVEWQGTLMKQPLHVEATVFDLNSANPRVTETYRCLLTENKTKRVLFDITTNSDNVVLIIKLEKPYEGDLNTWSDQYSKGKITQEGYVKGYRQSFGWFPVFLFDDDVLGKTQTVGAVHEGWTEWMYRMEDTKLCDEDMLSVCKLMKAKSNVRKQKQLPIRLLYRTDDVGAVFQQDQQLRVLEEFSMASLMANRKPQNHLFCWPQSLNLSKAPSNFKNICIKVQLVSNDNTGDRNRIMKTVYDENGQLGESFTTQVHYHNRTPFFSDEVKVNLPLPLTEKHHLLFTFSHISYKHRKEDAIVGYAFLRLTTTNNCFVPNGEFKLPITTTLPEGYLSEIDEGKSWLDTKKHVFTCKLRLSSSFYSQDQKQNNFYQQAAQTFNPEQENSMSNAIRELVSVDPISLCRFWPITMNELSGILCSDKFTDVMGKKTFRGIIGLVGAIHGDFQRKHPIVVEYLRNQFQRNHSWKKEAHEQLVCYWSLLLEENDPSSRDILKYSWVFFEMISKSMTEFLARSNKLSAPVDKRKGLFGDNFLQALEKLVGFISAEVYKLSKTGLNIAKDLNESLAQFFISILSCIPVESAFKFIWAHLKGFSMESAITADLRFEFLKTICAYEHSVALSFPTKSMFNILKSSDIQSHQAKFFFPHILQMSIAECLNNTASTEETRRTAFLVLFSILNKYEVDPRYNQPEAKKLIFGMFLSTIIAFCDNIDRIPEPEEEEQSQSPNSPVSQIALQPVFKRRTSNINTKPFTKREVKLFAVCVATILRYIDKDYVMKWMERESSTRCNAFLNGLSSIQLICKYMGVTKIPDCIKDGIITVPKSAANTAKKYIENMYKAGPNQVNLRELRGNLRQEGNKASVRGTTRFATGADKNEPVSPKIAKLVCFQSNEVALIVTGMIYHSMNVLKSQEARGLNPSSKEFERLFAVLKTVLISPQNKSFLPLLLRVLGKTVVDFSKMFFKGSRSCADLSEVLLRQLGSCFEECRFLAAETTYLLMRANLLETKSNIGKIKIQLTVAMSKTDAKAPSDLKLGLFSVEQYALRDSNCPKSFAKMVSEFIRGLIDILRDKFKVELSKDDPEMQEDMFFRLAKGYANAPDLRLAILETISEHHNHHKQYSEAAFCKLHGAALINEYLRMKGINTGITTEFKKISANLIEEKAPSNDINPDEEGICQGPAFSEGGFIDIVTQAIQYLKKANLFELAIDAQKLLLPLNEKQRNFKALAQMHDDIKVMYEQIVATTGKRVFATYFKVAFCGSKFGALDGQQFIYKERTVTQLSEIVQRLTETFRKKLGADFELINDAAKFVPEQLDKNKAYINIVHVQPYFTQDQLLERPTYFDRMDNLTKFVYERPYTMNGKAQGEIEFQYKKKTILTVEKPFPYIKKRLLVTSIKDIDMTPIEVSIDAIDERCEKLKIALTAKPLNLKNIQLLLQGIVQPQVNRGPLEIAATFLDKSKKANYPADKVSNLKAVFKQMAELCFQALRLSKMYAPADQTEFNESLEEGYNSLKLKIEFYVEDQVNMKRESTMSDFAFMKEEGAKFRE